MSTDGSFHMSPEEFRRWGYAVVDWVADYQRRVASLPVVSRVQPGEIRASLPAEPPQKGEPFEAILADVEKLILPGITHWQSPNFFAFFPANNSGPSILGELVSAALGVQGMLWATSPACTELETHILDWLVAMLGLPEKFKSAGAGGGAIQDTASSGVLCALLAARERATGLQSNERGCDGRLSLHFPPRAFVGGKGSEDCRAGPREPEADRGGRRFRDAARRLGAANRPGPPSGAAAVLCVGHSGHDLVQCL